MIGTAADNDLDQNAGLGDAPQDGIDLDAQAPPSMRVVVAIARATGADPAEMAPIYGAVDPDALDRLFQSDADVHFQFEYADHLVEVQGDGTILVDGKVAGGR